jgi:multidrug transporter EmrE-like cation transporter
MRDSPAVQVQLRRFEVWRTAVALVALAALASCVAWAITMAGTNGDQSMALVFGLALALATATVALAISLLRMPAGVLSAIDGGWTFSPDAGASVSGALTVAMDWGGFLLLRLESGPRAHLWLPVQRRGVENDWHALRCAVHARSRTAHSSPAEAGQGE